MRIVMTDPRQENFMADLQALLNKHDAELEGRLIRSDGGYIPTCAISFPSDPYRPHFEFELPTYLGPNGES